LAPFT
jgi:dynein heavy chain